MRCVTGVLRHGLRTAWFGLFPGLLLVMSACPAERAPSSDMEAGSTASADSSVDAPSTRAGQGDDEGGDDLAGAVTADSPDREVRPERVESALTRGDTLPGRPSWTREDRAVLEATVVWARREGVDTLPVWERVARIGERFVGAPYLPQTLDPPGPERLVVNLRAFDCVTFVESVMALAHVVTRPPGAAGAGPGGPTAVSDDLRDGPEGSQDGPGDTEALMDAYEEILTSIRYRDGRLRGYPSRLHYFSEWIADNEAKGFVLQRTAELGGVLDREPPTFMTEHREAYRQLADPATFEAVGRMEARLADAPRHVIPEERVKGLEGRIRSGDIIAATSTLPGLDVAHTGIALRRDGVLHLMHAPLVGEAVQISEASLGERLLGLAAQDGIMVARPQERPRRF